MSAPILRIALRHMENSLEIQNHIDRSLKKVLDFLENEPSPVFVNLMVTPSTVHAHHEVELVIKSPHYEAVVKKEGPIFFQTLDIVIDDMYLKLHEEKRKLTDNHKDKRLLKDRDRQEYQKKDRVQKK